MLSRAKAYETAIDSIPEGVCVFDGEGRLVVCNRPFAEIYRLDREQIQSGASLREIEGLRAIAELLPFGRGDSRSPPAPTKPGDPAHRFTASLGEGRTVRVRCQPTADGSWISIHQERVEAKDDRAAELHLSLQALIDEVPDNLWVKDVDSRFVIANKATAARTGADRTDDLIGRSDFELCPPDKAREYFADEQRIIRSGKAMIDKEEAAPSGDRTWILTTKVPLRNRAGEIIGLIGVSRDITERRKADLLRRGQAGVLEMIASGAPLESVLDRLATLVESQLSDVACAIMLLEEDGLRFAHSAAPSLPRAFVDAIEAVPAGPTAGSCGTAVYRRAAVIVADILQDPLWRDLRDQVAPFGFRSCWATPVYSQHGQTLGAFALYATTEREPAQDETQLIDTAARIAGIAIERRLAEERIHFMANHDALTGLPNRALLKDRLSQAVLYAKRYDQWATVAFIDLDNFKVVNDSLGHNAGDELLKAVAARMVACVRATDTVVRLGGDEFVVLLLDQPKSKESISATLSKIRAAIAEPIELAGRTVSATSSMGVASYPNDGADADMLLANADAAMYRAKELGRDNLQFYTPELSVGVHGKLFLQEELRSALTRGEFVLNYQPQVDLRTKRIFAVEALIRWNHPKLGLIAPLKFIPLAEESGLIVSIGNWVLREGCRQNKAWQDTGAPPITVCVNVSPRQFREKDFAASVAKALADTGLEAKYLELEVTESMVMRDVDLALSTMEKLQRLGVHLAIDDFGTGYSSLSALKMFPVARLKIDRSFIKDLPLNENDKAVTTAVISLARKLNMKVIAEGVETAEQMTFLRDNDCDEVQGYHFSRPVAADAIEAMLGDRTTGK